MLAFGTFIVALEPV
ncbi:hypothetical protein [Lactobacillus kefiranofaciens]